MLKPARVLQHHYNALTQKWSKVQSEILIEEAPFAEGQTNTHTHTTLEIELASLSTVAQKINIESKTVSCAFRAAYASLMPWDGNPSCPFVCKFAKDSATPKSMYFNDVEAHEIATLYARKFNEHLPDAYPRIDYVPAFIVEFVDRPGRPVCGCEQRLGGKFKKYNNNVGAVCAMTADEQAELQRTSTLANWDPTSTAQAFSHFSYEHSACQVLICDIQGVENRFTDPQIHTMSGKGFGLGNLGQTGIRAFLLRHTCTDLCRAVGLQPIKAKDLSEKQLQPTGFHHQERHAPPGSNLGGAGTAGGPGGSSNASSSSSNQQGAGGMMKRPPHNPSSYDPSRTGGISGGGGGGGGGSDVLVIDEPSAASAAPRSMRSSASTAFISHQASQAVMGRPNQQQQQQQQHQQQQQARDRPRMPPPATHSFTQPPGAMSATHSRQQGGGASASSSNPSPAPSPSASPTNSARRNGATPAPAAAVPFSSSSAASSSATPAAPKKEVCLDDSDEALMASIMGD